MVFLGSLAGVALFWSVWLVLDYVFDAGAVDAYPEHTVEAALSSK